ncbi:hypothetical protein PR048_030713 [Dryococelus australis]|uniref:Uncharacterized protein n=1 Tax=Dryococelus australis TaxID=614101 RepID=A0ABQ9G9P6_9NEOP|nr:hypothetical protein PR048_030713 [Dryococelus australis]
MLCYLTAANLCSHRLKQILFPLIVLRVQGVSLLVGGRGRRELELREVLSPTEAWNHTTLQTSTSRQRRSWNHLRRRTSILETGWDKSSSIAIGCCLLGKAFSRLTGPRRIKATSARPLLSCVTFLTVVLYWGRGGRAVRSLASHQGEPGSIPGRAILGLSQVGIVPDDAGRFFSGISRFPHPRIPALLHSLVVSPASALKTSSLGAPKSLNSTRSGLLEMNLRMKLVRREIIDMLRVQIEADMHNRKGRGRLIFRRLKYSSPDIYLSVDEKPRLETRMDNTSAPAYRYAADCKQHDANTACIFSALHVQCDRFMCSPGGEVARAPVHSRLQVARRKHCVHLQRLARTVRQIHVLPRGGGCKSAGVARSPREQPIGTQQTASSTTQTLRASSAPCTYSATESCAAPGGFCKSAGVARSPREQPIGTQQTASSTTQTLRASSAPCTYSATESCVAPGGGGGCKSAGVARSPREQPIGTQQTASSTTQTLRASSAPCTYSATESCAAPGGFCKSAGVARSPREQPIGTQQTASSTTQTLRASSAPCTYSATESCAAPGGFCKSAGVARSPREQPIGTQQTASSTTQTLRASSAPCTYSATESCAAPGGGCKSAGVARSPREQPIGTQQTASSTTQTLRASSAPCTYSATDSCVAPGGRLQERWRSKVVDKPLAGHWLEVDEANGSEATKANRVQSPAGPLPDFRAWVSSRGDVAGRRDFSGLSRFPRSSILSLLRPHLALPSLALKSSLLRASQISSLTHSSIAGLKRAKKNASIRRACWEGLKMYSLYREQPIGLWVSGGKDWELWRRGTVSHDVTDAAGVHAPGVVLQLDSSVLCILEPQLCVHWLLPRTWQLWDSQGFSLQVCYWLRGVQAALIVEVLRADEGGTRCVWSSAGMQGRGGGKLQVWFAMVRGEQANRSTTAAALSADNIAHASELASLTYSPLVVQPIGNLSLAQRAIANQNQGPSPEPCHSQPENGDAHVKGTVSPSRLCVYSPRVGTKRDLCSRVRHEEKVRTRCALCSFGSCLNSVNISASICQKQPLRPLIPRPTDDAIWLELVRLHNPLYSRVSDVCSLAAAPALPHTWQHGIRFLFPCKSAVGSESSRACIINSDPIAKVTVYTRNNLYQLHWANVSPCIQAGAAADLQGPFPKRSLYREPPPECSECASGVAGTRDREVSWRPDGPNVAVTAKTLTTFPWGGGAAISSSVHSGRPFVTAWLLRFLGRRPDTSHVYAARARFEPESKSCRRKDNFLVTVAKKASSRIVIVRPPSGAVKRRRSVWRMLLVYLANFFIHVFFAPYKLARGFPQSLSTRNCRSCNFVVENPFPDPIAARLNTSVFLVSAQVAQSSD